MVSRKESRECGDSNILYSLVISKGRGERYQGEMGEVSLLQATFEVFMICSGAFCLYLDLVEVWKCVDGLHHVIYYGGCGSGLHHACRETCIHTHACTYTPTHHTPNTHALTHSTVASDLLPRVQ